MRKHVWALCLLCVLYAQSGFCGGYKSAPLPDVRKVLQFFFQNHSRTPEDAQRYVFEKHPDMWVVRALNYERSSFQAGYSDTIWSAKKPVLKVAGIWAKPNNTDIPDYNDIIGDANEVLMYTNSPAYGYAGWQDDAINVLESNRKDLDDTMLYMLGRAYSEKATSAYYDRYGFDLGQNTKSKLTPAEKKSFFVTNEKLAIEVYAQLKDKNPDFPTNAGRILTKWANESLYAYFMLQAFAQDVTSAQGFIKGGMYDPYIVRATKKLLDVCTQNSVLITYSDNDFFPMLYVQALMNYRRDIRLVCAGMLTIPDYIAYLQRDMYGKDFIRMRLQASDYKDVVMPFIGMLKGQGDNAVSVNDLLDGLKTGKYKNAQYSFPVMTENAVSYTDKAGKIKNKWTVQKPFLYSSDIALMDILQNNGKPVYFSGMDKKFIPVFPAAFVYEGFMFHFIEGANEQFDADKINNMLQSMMSMGKPTPCMEHKLIANMTIEAMGFMIANETPETKLRAESISALSQRFFTEPYFTYPDKTYIAVATYCYKHKRKTLAEDIVKLGLEHCDYYTKNLSFNPSEYLDARKHQLEIATELAEAKNQLNALLQANK